MHHQLKEIRCALTRATAALAELEQAMARTVSLRFADCMSPNVPGGYDTVLGYLAKHHPDVLDQFDYTDPQATQRDGFWLSHRVRKRGGLPVQVMAPMCLRRAGIETVNAYPLDLLAKRWEWNI
jgi:hypothetical protein